MAVAVVEQLEELQELLDAALELNPKKKSQLVRKQLPKLSHYVNTIIRCWTSYGDNADEAFEKGWAMALKRPKPLYWVEFPWRSNCRCVVYFCEDPTEEARHILREALVHSVMAA